MGHTNVGMIYISDGLFGSMNDGLDLCVRFGAAAKNRFENGECNVFHCSAVLKYVSLSGGAN